MKFSANLSMLFGEYPFESRFKAASNAGFRAVEFWFPFHEGGVRLVAVAQEAEVQVVMFNLDPGEIDFGEWGTLSIPGREDHFKHSLEEALSIADKFHCQLLHILAGKVPEATTPEECWETALENLRWAVQQVPWNMKYVLEALNPVDMPRYLLAHPADARRLVKEFNHPNVRQLYDIYHAYRVGEDVVATLKSQKEWTAHIQLADFPGRHQPGTGEMPFDEILSTIREIDYQGLVGLEYRPLGPTEGSLTWIENWKGSGSDHGN